MKSHNICALLLLFVVLAAACNHTVSRDISSEQVGTKYAKLEGYFRSADMVEEVPGDIRHAAVLDEALLSVVDDGETCADVIIRNARRYDEPLSQYGAQCTSGREQAEAVVENEEVSVYDYNYTGRVETVAVDAVAADVYMGLSVSEPGEKTFRVIERQGRLCCPMAAREGLKLSFDHPRMDYNNLSYKLAFDWRLR